MEMSIRGSRVIARGRRGSGLGRAAELAITLKLMGRDTGLVRDEQSSDTSGVGVVMMSIG